MKFVVLLFALFAACSTQAMAQNNPKVELFGGYSYTRSDFFRDELGKINRACLEPGRHPGLSCGNPVT